VTEHCRRRGNPAHAAIKVAIVNRFTRALGHVRGVVYLVFGSDEALDAWIAALNADRPPPQDCEVLLHELTRKLNTGWVFKLLANEDRSEEVGVIDEAVLEAIRAQRSGSIDRSEFSYSLTYKIVNQVVRRLNRTAGHMQQPFDDAHDPLVFDVVNPELITESNLKLIVDVTARYLEKKGLGGDLVKVLRAWPAAMEEVEQSGLATRVTPMAKPVIEAIALITGLTTKAVEAAIKRILRAVRNSRD
jgi:hypothetical protein